MNGLNNHDDTEEYDNQNCNEAVVDEKDDDDDGDGEYMMMMMMRTRGNG